MIALKKKIHQQGWIFGIKQLLQSYLAAKAWQIWQTSQKTTRLFHIFWTWHLKAFSGAWHKEWLRSEVAACYVVKVGWKSKNCEVWTFFYLWKKGIYGIYIYSTNQRKLDHHKEKLFQFEAQISGDMGIRPATSVTRTSLSARRIPTSLKQFGVKTLLHL